MGGPKVVVTLVCTHADEDEVDDIFDGLRAVGREAELIVGIEQQPRLIADAIERSGDWGLIVLCSSPRLSEDACRKAEGLFSARRGPNHAMVRVDLSQGVAASVAAISRAYDGFVSSRGRIGRRSLDEHRPKLAEHVCVGDSAVRPIVRLSAKQRGDDPDSPQTLDDSASSELSRRRRAARAREREQDSPRSTHTRTPSKEYGVGAGSRAALQRDENRLDRMMIVLIVGAGLLAVLAALSLAF